MNITKRRALLALVTVVVVLFGLTLSSCKDCNSNKNRGKGKAPLGDGSSADNSGDGSSTGSSDDGSVADNSSDESSADNSTSTGKNNPALPKEKRVLTQAEKNELDNLRGELVAAAKKINDVKVVGTDIVWNSNIGKARQMLLNNYAFGKKTAVREDEIWLSYLGNMYMCQILWVRYLCGEFDANRIPAEDNCYKRWAGTNKENADRHERKGKAVWRVYTSLSDRNKLEELIVPAQQEWDDLVAKENAYRNALRRFEVI